MFVVTVRSHFAAAHHLRHLHGKCEALHGHNWKVEVSISSKRVGPGGIVLDFGILKQHLEAILRKLDHTDLNSLPYFARREPSSENIAKYVYDQFKRALRKETVTVLSVTAWESETSSATYFGGRS